MRALAALAVAAGIVLAPRPAAAQSPVVGSLAPAVALVLEVRGATDPPLKPYRELRTGDVIRLLSGAKLVVLDYRARGTTCRTLTLEGGVITFKPKGDPVIQGGVVSTRESKCPRRLPTTSTAGVIITREVAARLPVTPAFIIGGVRGGDVGRIRVLKDGASVADVPVTGQPFTWPAGTPALTANEVYTFEFRSRADDALLGVRTFLGTVGEPDASTVVIVD